MTVVFIVPCFNAQDNLNKLIQSLADQSDQSWRVVFIDDMSSDDTVSVLNLIQAMRPDQASVIINTEKKHALRNVVENALRQDPDDIIAVLDGDDQLCNTETVRIIKEMYEQGADAVWTAHRWDINDLNISRELPRGINPYQHPWVSSHLKTFQTSLLSQVPVSNFKDPSGSWFSRGYDQALYLPLLYKSKKRVYLPEVCYLYNINSVSMPNRNWAERNQLSTINFVRARGFLDE